MKISIRTALVGLAATCLLSGVGFASPASANSETADTSDIGVSTRGHGTKWDYHLLNLESITIHRKGTRGYGGWELAADPDVPKGGKYFVYDADTGTVPQVLDPDRDSTQSLYEVSDWKDVAFSYFEEHVEVRYGNYHNPKASLLVASASRYDWLADVTSEKFTGHGKSREEAESAARSEMKRFESEKSTNCQWGASAYSQDGEIFSYTLYAECGR